MRAHPISAAVETPARDGIIHADTRPGNREGKPETWLQLRFVDAHLKDHTIVVRAGVAVAIADAVNMLIV